MYQEGRGVPRDYVMAYMWFTLAAAGGEDSSKNAMNLIAPKLTMSQLAEAQRRALSWTAQYKEAQK
jgi:TPR repeat protein